MANNGIPCVPSPPENMSVPATRRGLPLYVVSGKAPVPVPKFADLTRGPDVTEVK